MHESPLGTHESFLDLHESLFGTHVPVPEIIVADADVFGRVIATIFTPDFIAPVYAPTVRPSNFEGVGGVGVAARENVLIVVKSLLPWAEVCGVRPCESGSSDLARGLEILIRGTHMATSSYLPREEAKLVTFTGEFLANIALQPTNYGLVAQDAADYKVSRDRFVASYNLVQNPITRTPPNIEAKNVFKKALVNATRSLVDVIQAWPSMTNEKRRELKITERGNRPTPSPIPGTPFVKIESIDGRDVTLSLQQSRTNKGRPKGVSGANVFVFYGSDAPATTNGWQFETGTGKSKVTLNLGAVETACTVWITAFWFNGRKQSGQAATPISVNLSAITPLPQAMKINKAA